MTLDEYQHKARRFATGGGLRLDYAVMGLAEEAGEAVGKMAKFIRKFDVEPTAIRSSSPEREHLVLELGDCLWMVANAAAALGVTLDELAAGNLDKLEGRLARGIIIGEGDER